MYHDFMFVFKQSYKKVGVFLFGGQLFKNDTIQELIVQSTIEKK